MKLFSKNFLLLVVLFFATLLSTVKAQQTSANVNDIMFQTFGWDVHQQKIVSDEGGLYNFINNRASGYAVAGFNVLWLPPPSKSTGGVGYIPTELFNFSQTSYGSEAQLRAMLTTLNTSSPRIHPMADIVVNHRGGTTNWMDFTNPTWDCKSVVSNDEASGPLNTSGIKPCGTADTGDGFDGGRDLDHTNSQVQSGVKEFLTRLKGLGFDSWRWDVAKGFSASYFGDYIEASTPYSSVGEYWDGNRNTLKNWVDGTRGKSAAFDFDLYYDLIDAVNNGNYGRLAGGYPGLAGIFGYADKTVTFVDNHDTFVKGSIITSDNIMKGYAYIMTHPGVPCVFFPHYYGGTYKKENVTVVYTANEIAINKLMAIRRATGINAYSSVVVSNAGNFYSAIISNNGIDKVAVKIGPGSWDPGAGWVLNTFGTDYAVWSKAAINFNFSPTATITPLSASYVSGASQLVTITATDDKVGTTIYYTTDGSTPTTSSAVYTSPISVSTTTTVKAIARDAEGLFSGIPSQTYTFLTIGDITVKVKPPTSWSAPIKVHHFNAIPSANLANSTWNGKTMTGPDANGYYSYTFNNIASTDIIFTRGTGSPQTQNADIKPVTKSTCYNMLGWTSGFVTVEDCTTLGVNDSEFNNSQLKLYPNPTHGAFKINKAISNLSIFDITGKVVKQFNGTFQSDASYDISSLVKGMYFVKLKTISGIETTLKLSKE
ncbi:chitobiase/beta-hexosaminidase C-terminal domain-containing protein [Flavobacterium luteum]|uniref:T9SS type A sorting domain-containing protein n=1 Tax=Flavobacterium luteum TaxID=2026654 RepID=A0A7J5A7P9_9FLAO|nr:chitobiase/beta-hexosaminidase C-terminal domain-containing protein [Flavobacterium luteum]KAB1153590.1 T9SS type A sorting domain-containing protein [Flavobacterium luteum]